MSGSRVFLRDYVPYPFSLDSVELLFDFQSDSVSVQNKMLFRRVSDGALCLNGEELELKRILMDGVSLTENDFRIEDDKLLINNCPDAFELVIETVIYPEKNTNLSGLFRTGSIFCTQCEAEGMRRMTFFPDRPDVLSCYTVTIIADKKTYPVLLSNGNEIENGELENDRHFAKFQDPFKKPCYLFALVAGDLAWIEDVFITASSRKILLRMYVEHGYESQARHAMESVKKAMRWDEVTYGREYDLDVYFIVAVSDFNMGAMENKGLNIFNSKYVLADMSTATDQDFIQIESVIGHEYFHNWTGNRITCRDWFQLSLKEGLTVFRDQEFSRDMNSRDVQRIDDVKVLRAIQFPEDSGSMAHPVRPDSYEEINNFYTATIYNKGAEVIRMQQTVLGKEAFRRGMDLYFERHDGHAVTIEDFVKAMEDASSVSFDIMRRWYTQAGTPTLRAESHFKGDTLTLTLSQSCKKTSDGSPKLPFHIPVNIALFDKKGQKLSIPRELIELKDEKQTFEFSGFSEKPIVSLLRDFSAPVNLEYETNDEEKLLLFRFETNGYARYEAGQQLALQAIENGLAPSFVEACAELLSEEENDFSLRAELLEPPGFEEVIRGKELIDVDLIEAVRRRYRTSLGNALLPRLYMLYEALYAKEDNLQNGTAYGRRRLKNLALWFLMKVDEKNAIPLCHRQYKEAQNMTDSLSALKFLAHAEEKEIGDGVLQDFYKKWSKNALVLDKWFSVQATDEHREALPRVRALTKHPDFALTNPNRVRSLVGAFAMANPAQFHRKDGKGYVFLREIIEALDAKNPQVAARLLQPFTVWRRYDENRQKAITDELRYLEGKKLSKDVREVVSQSLKVD